ncbi:transglutaminase-like cysteine peptidase [Sphingomonas ginkgonis]|nr:transglutaminase-like cysteine peptidase [Sphingomonas ginkgonis]
MAGSLWQAAALLALAGNAIPASAAESPSEEAPLVVRGTPAARAPEVFGTVGLPVRAERYAELWNHVLAGRIDAPALQHFVAPARRLEPAAQLAFVQRAAGQLRWRSDATVWGQHEYWATAAETLQAGYADDDCLAVLKMQALQALGWSPRNLYLTIGHDQVAGATTVLLVRTGEGFQLLDDRSERPLPAAERSGFVPQLSFSSAGHWLHGRLARTGGATLAAR